MLLRRIACAAAVCALLAPAAHAASNPVFVDWTAAAGQTATGTFLGRPVTISGPLGPSPVVDGSFKLWDEDYFTPRIPAGDYVDVHGLAGNRYVLSFGVPVRDPVIHLASLASKIVFDGSPPVTKLSGQPGLTVGPGFVSGQADAAVHVFNDSNGTVQLTGDFESLSFSVTPTYTPVGQADGIYFQIGGTLPPGPESTARPTMTGVPSPSHELSCGTGTWSRPIAAYTYAWERAPRATTADDDPNWTAIEGASAATYTVQHADSGSRVRCRVTAADAKTLAGTAASTSLRADDAAPSPGTGPSIAGTGRTGEPLVCDPGTWYGGPDFATAGCATASRSRGPPGQATPRGRACGRIPVIRSRARSPPPTTSGPPPRCARARSRSMTGCPRTSRRRA